MKTATVLDRSVILLTAVAGLAGLSSLAQAQCPSDWVSAAPQPGLNLTTLSTLTTSEGTFLYAGGSFNKIGSISTLNIARWDGQAWSAMGTGIPGMVRAITAYDTGSGAAIIAAKDNQSGPPGISRWANGQWSPLGTNQNQIVAKALLAHDWDGAGPQPQELFVGGLFDLTAGGAGSGIATLVNDQWVAVGGGVTGYTKAVYALASHDDGSGPAVYAAGFFTSAGGLPANRIAKWNGKEWSAVGMGLGKIGGDNEFVSALISFDTDGPGPLPAKLFAGGTFAAGGAGDPLLRIAQWDGSAWSGVGGGMTNTGTYISVWELGTFERNGNPVLVAGGYYTQAGSTPANDIATWDGNAWQAMAEGITPNNGGSCCLLYGVPALASFPAANGPELFAGGFFTSAGTEQAFGLARWAPCGVSCFADANGDNTLNIDDFVYFQTQFALGDGGADCTGEGDLSIDDFVCFQTAFAVGC